MLKTMMAATVAVLVLAGQAMTDEWRKVVSPAELSRMLDDVVVVDIRPADAHQAGHIDGARSAPYGTWRGPADNPGSVLSDAALTERMQSLGLRSDSKVVIAYPGGNATQFGAAARVYWTLKSAGLTKIAILNGGMQGWEAAGLGLSTAATVPAWSTETFALSEDWQIDRDGVQSVLDGRRDAVMIDARPAAFWKGETQHKAAAAAGTLDGALNITHESWFGGDKTEILTGAQVLEIARASGYIEGKTELVSFCNTGHWAATNWFALSELAGIEGVKLYPESMVGWTNAGGKVVNGR